MPPSVLLPSGHLQPRSRYDQTLICAKFHTIRRREKHPCSDVRQNGVRTVFPFHCEQVRLGTYIHDLLLGLGLFLILVFNDHQMISFSTLQQILRLPLYSTDSCFSWFAASLSSSRYWMLHKDVCHPSSLSFLRRDIGVASI